LLQCKCSKREVLFWERRCFGNERRSWHHKGEWLTTEVASIYAAKSWIYRVYEGGQYCGKVREIGTELQERYGVTELEAINILFEHNVADYVNRYYRMKNRISGYVDEQRICDEVIATYLLAM
jgi:hypothetical protein